MQSTSLPTSAMERLDWRHPTVGCQRAGAYRSFRLCELDLFSAASTRILSVKNEEPDSTPPKAFAEKDLGTAEELLAELLPHQGGMLWGNDYWGSSWLFRGQMDASWGLTPSAMREGAVWAYAADMPKRPKRADDSAELNSYHEANLVRRFVGLADKHGIELPHDSPELRNGDWLTGPRGFPPTKFEACFALAQHYGVPTRLLDWSRSALVGAYFACNQTAEYALLGYEDHAPRYNLPENEPERFAVWAFNDDAPMRGGDRDFVDGVRIVTAPTANNPNLHAQSGCFTVVEVANHASHMREALDLDDFVAGFEEHKSTKAGYLPALVKFTVPTKEAGRLLRLLSFMDITAASMFPGLNGVEQQLFESKLHQ